MEHKRDTDRSRIEASESEIGSLHGSSVYRAHDVSIAYPASTYSYAQSGVTVVDVEPGPVMFPTKPKAALVVSIVFTFICCFACSIPAIVLSKKQMDLQTEGEKGMARRMTNTIAFWLILSVVFGIIFWAGMGLMYDSLFRWTYHRIAPQFTP